MNAPGVSTLADASAAQDLLRGFVTERHPAGSFRWLDEDELPGFPGGWVLEHDGGFALLRVPALEQTMLSVRAGVAVEIPRSSDLAHYVACENKNVMAGRLYLAYGDNVALVVLEEVLWGRALSWQFEPSLADFITRFDYVVRQAQEVQSVIINRFGGRPFHGDEWIHLVL